MLKLLNSFKSLPREDSFRSGSTNYGKEEEVPSNTINELQILTGHNDIVRLLLRIDDTRFVSGSDDGVAIVWNYCTGGHILSLKGHTLPITCMLLLQRNLLVTGSTDRTIRMWNLINGECIKVLSAHQGSVKCLALLEDGSFVSGGNDRQICVWSDSGELQGSIERQEEENLNCLLCVSDKCLVTGSNSSLLLVYNTENFQFHKLLAYHRESVQCLVKISNSLFASASLDGTIVVWQTDTLTPFNILQYPDKYKNDNKVFIYTVRTLMPLGERYLAVAVAMGFQIYDVLTGDCLVEIKNAHESDVSGLISLYMGSRILSCSSDSSIKIWGPPKGMDFFGRRNSTTNPSSNQTSPLNSPYVSIRPGQPQSQQNPPSPTLNESRSVSESLRNVITPSKKKRKPPSLPPTLIGEMWGHSEAVYHMISVSENSLVSCGGDGVILWKDGKIQSELRNTFATVSLIKHQALEEYHQHLLDEMSDEIYSSNIVGELRSSDSDMEDTPVVFDGEGSDATNVSIGSGSVHYVFSSNNQGQQQQQQQQQQSDDSLKERPTLSIPNNNNNNVNSIKSAKRGNSSNNLLAQNTSQKQTDSKGIWKKERSVPDIQSINNKSNTSTSNSNLTSSKEFTPSSSMRLVRVPEYIISRAEMLFNEKSLTIDQVASLLRDEGHSEAVVTTVTFRLMHGNVNPTDINNNNINSSLNMNITTPPFLSSTSSLKPTTPKIAGASSVIEDYERDEI